MLDAKRESRARGRAGFTLIEVLVAAAILAVLAGVSIPVVAAISRKAKVAATKSEMAGVAKALRTYAKDVGFKPSRVKWGRFPPEARGKGKYKTILGLDLEKDTGGVGWDPVARRGWNGPYLAGETTSADADGDGRPETVRDYQVDAWGRYYIYLNRDDGGHFVGKKDKTRVVRLVSGGPDHDPGTAGDNIELTVFRGPIY